MNELTHLDLFSGIGGFSLAAEWAGFRTVAFSEIHPYASAVLRKHWPAVPNLGDIRAIDGEAYSGVTLLTGGFPCQPWSCAGKRLGINDDRHLWPSMLRIISQARPTWVVGENVAGIIGMEFADMLAQLEGEEYSVQPIVIPACARGTRHRRNRVWILAHSERDSIQGRAAFSEEGFQSSGDEQLAGFLQSRFRPSLSESRAYGTPHGIPRTVDRNLGLGNTIVPEIAFQILKVIAQIERGEMMETQTSREGR